MLTPWFKVESFVESLKSYLKQKIRQGVLEYSISDSILPLVLFFARQNRFPWLHHLITILGNSELRRIVLSNGRVSIMRTKLIDPWQKMPILARHSIGMAQSSRILSIWPRNNKKVHLALKLENKFSFNVSAHQ